MKTRSVPAQITVAAAAALCLATIFAFPGEVTSLPNVNEGEWRESPIR